MKISTKGRYALRVVVDLAEHNNGEFIKLMDVAERQNISEKYLEGIIASLTKSGLLLAVRGKGGGYRLAMPADSITAARVLRAAEGSIAPVACLENRPNTCPRADSCRTLALWEGLDRVINNYLEGITVADLATGGADNYCI